MKCVPEHGVIYKGEYRAAGKPFAIDPEDREELARYGAIVDEEPPRRKSRRKTDEE